VEYRKEPGSATVAEAKFAGMDEFGGDGSRPHHVHSLYIFDCRLGKRELVNGQLDQHQLD
jgi:hypothetical protein